jgi:hypothetical protein
MGNSFLQFVHNRLGDEEVPLPEESLLNGTSPTVPTENISETAIATLLHRIS